MRCQLLESDLCQELYDTQRKYADYSEISGVFIIDKTSTDRLGTTISTVHVHDTISPTHRHDAAMIRVPGKDAGTQDVSGKHRGHQSWVHGHSPAKEAVAKPPPAP
jgi:hypothetical protein